MGFQDESVRFFARLREQSGLTLKELGVLMRCNYGTVHKLLEGTQQMTLDYFERLCFAFDLTIEKATKAIIGGCEDENPKPSDEVRLNLAITHGLLDEDILREIRFRVAWLSDRNIQFNRMLRGTEATQAVVFVGSRPLLWHGVPKTEIEARIKEGRFDSGWHAMEAGIYRLLIRPGKKDWKGHAEFFLQELVKLTKVDKPSKKPDHRIHFRRKP